MWINQPTFQEKYGLYALLLGIFLSLFAYIGLSYQETQIQTVNKQTQRLKVSSQLYPNYSTLESKVSALEAYNRYSQLFPLIFKDVTLAIAQSDLSAENLSLQNPNPRTPPETLLLQVRVPTEETPTFAQQEAAAKKLLRSSLTLSKIRKPHAAQGAKSFMLEGLIPLKKVATLYQEYQRDQRAFSPQGDQK